MSFGTLHEQLTQGGVSVSDQALDIDLTYLRELELVDLAGELGEQLGARGVRAALAVHDVLELGMSGHGPLAVDREGKEQRFYPSRPRFGTPAMCAGLPQWTRPRLRANGKTTYAISV